MVKVVCGKTKTGEDCEIYIDGLLKKDLDGVKERVIKHNWDYVAITAGIPGSGKSTFVRTPARYCCHWFGLEYVVFTVEDFIKVTNNCPEFSSVVLDESFQGLNTRVTMSPAFIRLINHIQIIRKKHLFIFLCLPNFFDLAKGVAVFRASHLFITFSRKDGRRGRFSAFGRSEKRRLYVRGMKYMDYNAVRPNFVGTYTKNSIILNEKGYEKRKDAHLKAQEKKKITPAMKVAEKNRSYIEKFRKMGWEHKRIADFLDMGIRTVQNHITELRKEGKLP